MSTFTIASSFIPATIECCSSNRIDQSTWSFDSDKPVGRLGVLRRGYRTHGTTPFFASISMSGSNDRASTPASSSGRCTSYVLTPVGSKTGSRSQRYVWDGNRLRLLGLEALERGCASADDFQDVVSRMRDEVYHSFFPYEQDVTSDYWPWMRWRLAQRFFSSVMMHYATQSLLIAVGVGAKKAIAASAIINWMLKDGLGRAVRMGVATRYGRSFDADLKRSRFSTSVMLTLCMTGEFLTPLFPQHFLLLASVANAGKAVGLTTHVATLPVFHQALCRGANLGDIAAKTQAQHMLMDMLALGVSTVSAYLCRHSPRLRVMVPLLSFPVLGALDLLCTYKELKAVEVKTINRERCEMIADCWVREGRVPSTAEISERERLLFAPEAGPIPLEIHPLEDLITSLDQLERLLQRCDGQPYLVEVGCGRAREPREGPLAVLDRFLPKEQDKIMVALRSDAQSQDLIQLVLHSVILRRMLLDELNNDGPSSPLLSPSTTATSISTLDSSAMEELYRNSLAASQQQLPEYVRAMQQAGWQTHPFVRSIEEKSGFLSFDGDS